MSALMHIFLNDFGINPLLPKGGLQETPLSVSNE